MSIETLVQHYGLAAILLGAGLEGETAVLAGGVLAQQGLVSLPGAMAAASVGSCIADQLFFYIGRSFRDRAFVRRIAARPLFARALTWLEWWPVGFIFAFRFVYGFRTVSPVAIGATAVPLRLFVLVNIVAAIVWGCVFTLIGYLFGHALEHWIARVRPGRETLMIAAGVVIATVAIVLAVRHWRKAR